MSEGFIISSLSTNQIEIEILMKTKGLPAKILKKCVINKFMIAYYIVLPDNKYFVG